MLQTVDVGVESFDRYRSIIGAEKIREIRRMARELKGARVLQLNATPYGGGVSELLRASVPLMRDLGLEVDWKVIAGDNDFFKVTKSFHNALQGGELALTSNITEEYLRHNIDIARQFEEKYDYIVVHDPQPLALRHFKGENNAKWVWRCHIDTSNPNPEVWNFLNPYLDEYDATIFTLQQFVPPDVSVKRQYIIPPAIDALSPKNMDISMALCRKVISWIGVDLHRPLMTQVSRFDPWKDPEGVIDVYRMVKEDIPDLQLVLVGSMALDDPEAWQIYNRISEYDKKDPDCYIFTNMTGVGNIEVNAFQKFSSVMIQKSIREGFGLVVSETLWKGTPIVAGNTGGIPLQVEDGVSGYLCTANEDYAARIEYLIRNPEVAGEMGARGKETVREKFLMPRLIADELRCLCAL